MATFIEKAEQKTGKTVSAQSKKVIKAPAKKKEAPKEESKAVGSEKLNPEKKVVKRRPNLIAWSQIGVKVGQTLYYKGHHEIVATVQSDVTMELELVIPGQDPIRTPGLVESERKVRSHLVSPKKSPQGWDLWGFLEKDENGKDKWRSVYALYTSVYVLDK